MDLMGYTLGLSHLGYKLGLGYLGYKLGLGYMGYVLELCYLGYKLGLRLGGYKWGLGDLDMSWDWAQFKEGGEINKSGSRSQRALLRVVSGHSDI